MSNNQLLDRIADMLNELMSRAGLEVQSKTIHVHSYDFHSPSVIGALVIERMVVVTKDGVGWEQVLDQFNKGEADDQAYE